MTAIIKTNEYSASLHRLPEEKLREYIDRPDDYQDDAVLAAIWELENRRPLRSDEQSLAGRISDRPEVQIVAKSDIFIPLRNSNEIELPSLYSIRAIQVFSVLFSVLAGGILMAINFNKTTQKAEAVKVLGFSFAYTLVSVVIFTLFGTQSPLISIVLNLLGAYLIYELFWKRVLGLTYQFKKREIWSAMIIALIVIAPLMWYVIKSGVMPTIL